MFSKKKPEFTRDQAGRELREAESVGFNEGMNTTVWPDDRRSPYSGWLMGGDAWDTALREARSRGWHRGQELRRQEILRICEARSDESDQKLDADLEAI